MASIPKTTRLILPGLKADAKAGRKKTTDAVEMTSVYLLCSPRRFFWIKYEVIPITITALDHCMKRVPISTAWLILFATILEVVN